MSMITILEPLSAGLRMVLGLEMSLVRALQEIIWDISRRSEALQGPFVLVDESVSEGM